MFSASLFSGAVTMPPILPDRASCTPFSIALKAMRPPSAESTPGRIGSPFGVGLDETEVRPVTVHLGLGNRGVKAELLLREPERRAAADDGEAQVAGPEPVLQPSRRLDDDLRADAGGIAHGDCQMPLSCLASFDHQSVFDQQIAP